MSGTDPADIAYMPLVQAAMERYCEKGKVYSVVVCHDDGCPVLLGVRECTCASPEILITEFEGGREA